MAVIAALTGPGAWGVAAASGGVHFDPSSPAGQEYALPLERAREEAAGTQAQSGSNGSNGEGAGLFGAGVSGGGPQNGGAAGRPRGSAGNGSSTAGAGAGSGTARGGEARADLNGRPPPTNIELAETGGGFSLTAAVAIVAAILLAAAIAGLALRRLPSAAAP